MKDQSKTKQALIQELASLRQRIAELEQSESERKNVEGVFRDSEEELASIYENAPLIMLLVDKEWAIRKTNTLTAQFVGRAVGDMINLRCGESLHCIHSFDAPEGCGFGPSCRECTFRLTALSTIETAQSHHEVEASMSLSGAEKKREAIFLLSTARLTIKGQPMALVSMQDITERKKVEETLRESQEQLKDAHRLARIGIWNWIVDTDTVTWTEELYRIAGLDPMIPAPTYAEHSNIYAPESWDRLKVVVEKALETGTPYQLELVLIRPDGAIRWVNAFGGATYDSHGRVTGLQGTLQDITEHKQAEEALRRSEENFRRSLDESPLGVRIVTVEGETIYANRAILDIYGFDSIEELKTAPVEKRYTPESHAEFQIRREKRKRGDDVPSEYDISIVKKDDEVRHLQVFRKEIPWDGERQFQVLYNDITERKRMEEEKHHLEERSRKVVEDIFRFIPEGVLVFSRKMELLRQNQAFRDLVTGYARRLGFAEDELENLIIDKVKAGLRDNNIKEIKIARKYEVGKQN